MSFRVGDKVEWKSPLPSVVQTNDAGIVVSIAHPVLTRRGVNKAILVYEFIGSDREIFSVWSRCCPIGLLSESWEIGFWGVARYRKCPPAVPQNLSKSHRSIFLQSAARSSVNSLVKE